MFKKQTAMPAQTVGIYKTIQAASKQVDVLLRSSADICVNIVRSDKGYHVQTVAWQ